jgi:hypothetical protein
MTEEKVLSLVREEGSGWGYMPEFLHRVEAFCKAENTDLKFPEASRLIMQSFISDKPTMRLLLAFEDDKPVGHLIAVIEVYHGRNTLSIWQYALDNGFDRHLLQQAWEDTIEWAKSVWGAKEAYSSALDEKRARMDSIFWGFKPHRILMRREI